MAKWADLESWNDLVSGRSCPVCAGGLPSHVIAELPDCWLTMEEDAAPALPGTCALFLRRHAVELSELAPDEAASFIAAAGRVAGLLLAASGAVKLNYEVHGNTIPHLHMHFFPRYRGDPFEDGPIDPRRPGTPKDAGRHRAIRARLIEALAGATPE